MHVDDMAGACIRIMEEMDAQIMVSQSHPKVTTFMNIGTGMDQTIADLATLISQITGFRGIIRYDSTRPDGTFRKLLDISALNKMGFRPSYSLQSGIKHVYSLYSSY
jgi:GDP-L-fucose synthase